jgi:hypothetical protein
MRIMIAAMASLGPWNIVVVVIVKSSPLALLIAIKIHRLPIRISFLCGRVI